MIAYIILAGVLMFLFHKITHIQTIYFGYKGWLSEFIIFFIISAVVINVGLEILAFIFPIIIFLIVAGVIAAIIYKIYKSKTSESSDAESASSETSSNDSAQNL